MKPLGSALIDRASRASVLFVCSVVNFFF